MANFLKWKANEILKFMFLVHATASVSKSGEFIECVNLMWTMLKMFQFGD